MPIYEKIAPYVIAAISSSKGLGKIKTDFSDAINEDILSFWKSIKPIFIKEDSQTTTSIEDNVQENSKERLEKAKKDIEFVARSAIKADKANETKIEAALNGLMKKFPSEEVAMKIVGSHNVTIVNSNVSNSFNQNKP